MTRSPLARRVAPTAALLLISPVLASCGFNYATNRVNNIAMGANDRDGAVDVLGAVVVSGQPDTGTLVVTLINNSDTEEATLDGVAGTGEPALEATEFQPVTVSAQDREVLAEEGGVAVEGDFLPGQFVEVEMTFGDGSALTLDVPVVTPCDEYEGLDATADDADALEPEAANPEVEETEGLAEHDREPESVLYECELPEPTEH